MTMDSTEQNEARGRGASGYYKAAQDDGNRGRQIHFTGHTYVVDGHLGGRTSYSVRPWIHRVWRAQDVDVAPAHERNIRSALSGDEVDGAVQGGFRGDSYVGAVVPLCVMIDARIIGGHLCVFFWASPRLVRQQTSLFTVISRAPTPVRSK